MSLKIKCVHYNTVHLSTYTDLEAFKHELDVLIDSGFNITLDVSATNSLFQDPWSTQFPPIPRKKYEFGENGTSYDSTATSKTTSHVG